MNLQQPRQPAHRESVRETPLPRCDHCRSGLRSPHSGLRGPTLGHQCFAACRESMAHSSVMATSCAPRLGRGGTQPTHRPVRTAVHAVVPLCTTTPALAGRRAQVMASGVGGAIVSIPIRVGFRCGRTPHSYRSNVRGNGCGVRQPRHRSHAEVRAKGPRVQAGAATFKVLYHGEDCSTVRHRVNENWNSTKSTRGTA